MAASSTRWHVFAPAAAAPILLNIALGDGADAGGILPRRRDTPRRGACCSPVCWISAGGGRRQTRRRLGRCLRWPELDVDVRRQFFRALGPATVGSGRRAARAIRRNHHRQFLPAGALSALYYADRINQLPIGVIGHCSRHRHSPEMSRRLAAGDITGASHAQNRAVEFTLLLSIPCVRGVLHRAGFDHARAVRARRFTDATALAPAAHWRPYAFGLLPFVLIRSSVATFFARGDTATPVKAALIAAAVNIAI